MFNEKMSNDELHNSGRGITSHASEEMNVIRDTRTKAQKATSQKISKCTIKGKCNEKAGSCATCPSKINE